MFGKIGMSELVVVLIIALVIFGPSKLPEIGKAFGKALGEFRTHAKKISEDIEKDTNEL
ncbi:twin-arginine translocation protein TatA [Clostridium aceticum]|uniref:Sec-independent protein translocase protein TatA n=1 Tax=Clostridium aceticum TaxID=84022 RepID=A0A0D8IDR0_9CLOT|nr:twin-arginine translocase TatA/TatE family subunit [Clostridium aceticum]AKL94358.1 twin-arginine translocation protein TatA [Clostridium aceticum]KJF28408.1 primosome subunit DnaD [Clostridium aceticum]